MPTNVKVDDLKINKLTKAQYETAVQGGVIGEYELSVLTDDDTYATSAQLTQGLAAKQDTISDLATIRSGAAAGATAVQPAAIADMETQTHASATYATKTELADKQDIIQYSTMPTASVDNVDDIVQFVGTTDSTYTNGHFYKCVSDGQDPATYSWEEVSLGGSSLPDMTGQSGKFLTNNGSSASWGTVNALQNTATNPSTNLIVDGTSTSYSPTGDYNIVFGKEFQFSKGIIFGSYISHSGSTQIGYGNVVLGTFKTLYNNTRQCVVIGENGGVYGWETIAIGEHAGTVENVKSDYSIAIGSYAYCGGSYGCIQIGSGINTENQTLKIGFSSRWGGGAEYQYKLLDSDGTIPEARLADTTNATAGQVLTLDSNLVATWATPSGGASAPTLTWYTVSTAGNTLTIADTSSAQLVKVYKNGLLLQPTEDYSISGTTLTTVTAMVVGDKITTEVF